MVGAGFPGRILRVAVLASLLFSSTLFVSPSFGVKRDAPIRLRENLWATADRGCKQKFRVRERIASDHTGKSCFSRSDRSRSDPSVHLGTTPDELSKRIALQLDQKGHFMGKKSTLDSSHLPPLSEERVEPGNVLEAFSPALTDVFEDAKGLLMRELLKIILQQRLLEEEQGKGEAKGQETPSLMELLAKYI